MHKKLVTCSQKKRIKHTPRAQMMPDASFGPVFTIVRVLALTVSFLLMVVDALTGEASEACACGSEEMNLKFENCLSSHFKLRNM